MCIQHSAVAAVTASEPAPSFAAAAGTLEAVEVKNTCPFQAVSWVTAAGKRRSSYVVQDRGPRDEVCGVTHLPFQVCSGASENMIEFSNC